VCSYRCHGAGKCECNGSPHLDRFGPGLGDFFDRYSMMIKDTKCGQDEHMLGVVIIAMI
jgi:hypothetical protein